ncbi:hypothetical protein N8077_05850 [Myxococcota bacterium]|nr:hypothetical protein [Myxococcota bacterium]
MPAEEGRIGIAMPVGGHIRSTDTAPVYANNRRALDWLWLWEFTKFDRPLTRNKRSTHRSPRTCSAAAVNGAAPRSRTLRVDRRRDRIAAP